KHRHAAVAMQSLETIKARAERAAGEGRYQQSLELAKQLHKHEPSPINKSFLQQVYLGRARQLRSQGHTRDARTVLENALGLIGEDAALLEMLANELALCGDAGRAMQVVASVSDQAVQTRIMAHAVDAAVQQGQAGRSLLPQ